jgi:hypothetical protein
MHLGRYAFQDKYYEALGRFVAQFSEIEGIMQSALWELSGMKSPLAQALFSGVRTEEASSKIARIGVAQNWSTKRTAEWNAIFTHLGILRQLRNDLLHYGAIWQDDDNWLVTNRNFVHTPSKITNTSISVGILRDATIDLETLWNQIFRLVHGPNLDPRHKDEDLKEISGYADRAWRYKSPARVVGPQKPRDKAPKQ